MLDFEINKIYESFKLCNHKSGNHCKHCAYKNYPDCKMKLAEDAIKLIDYLAEKCSIEFLPSNLQTDILNSYWR